MLCYTLTLLGDCLGARNTNTMWVLLDLGSNPEPIHEQKNKLKFQAAQGYHRNRGRRGRKARDRKGRSEGKIYTAGIYL